MNMGRDGRTSIEKVKITNYRCFRSMEVNLSEGMNLIVGDNDVGKSTLVEAINLALTRRIGRDPIYRSITSYLIHTAAVTEFLNAVNNGDQSAEPPSALIELYFRNGGPELLGNNNSELRKASGVSLEIAPDAELEEEFKALVSSIEPDNSSTHLKSLPVEFYRDYWRTFASGSLDRRIHAITPFYANTAASRLNPRLDTFTRAVITDVLTPLDRLGIAREFREAREGSVSRDSLARVNDALREYGDPWLQKRELTVGVDMSTTAKWELNVGVHVEDLPIEFIGDGSRNLLKLMLATSAVSGADSPVVMIEEPENFQSHMRLRRVLQALRDLSRDAQQIVTTHDSYVINRLGLDEIVMLGGGTKPRYFRQLTADTKRFFQVASGFDTLRIVLAKRIVLVEGPSDELVFAKVYHQTHGRYPADDQVDVFAVNGTSFKRYLELAKDLDIRIAVVRDNDGESKEHWLKNYDAFLGGGNVELFTSEDPTERTLEDSVLGANSASDVGMIVGKEFSDQDTAAVRKYMIDRKTDTAYKIFEHKGNFVAPEYLTAAAKFIAI